MENINLFWFRRDLRLTDNAALYYALKDELPVLPIFIFDRNILDQLDNKSDARVEFIHLVVSSLQKRLWLAGNVFKVFYDYPLNVFKKLLSEYHIHGVFANHDYEPYSISRDREVAKLLKGSGVNFNTFKDHVIFEKNEIVKPDGRPYTVFTHYSRKWLDAFSKTNVEEYPVEKYSKNFLKSQQTEIPSLTEIGFSTTNRIFPAKVVADELISNYDKTRNFPGVAGTSRIGVHLRFGTVSIRQLVKSAWKKNAVYLNELIWREFYQAILFHFPHIGFNKSFRPEYDNIKWRNNEGEFERWSAGKTGYPIVDAGMRELNQTGFMHNRVRMIVASFLVKHLLIDWRWGEAYFAEKLLDYEMASNNGGWQWAAGSGCDAVPYFRIFNPALQTKKFDKDLDYIKKWVPEFQEFSYPPPMVDHEFARKRALQTYADALKKQ